MIPILFDSNETAFTSNGLGRLTDCTRCEVTEERNGIYECEFDYPISGAMFSQITEGRYIYTTHDESKTPQAFQIYSRTAPLEGVVTFRAWHISYLLNNIILTPYTADSCAQALTMMQTNTVNNNPFTFTTDKLVTAPYVLDVPTPIRAALGGQENSILDVYGKGEYEFDMWTVRLHINRGQNRGVSIRYGKNLMSLEQERDASGIYDGVVPYWKSSSDEDDTIVSLNHAVYRTGVSSGKITVRDFSDDFEEAPTTAQLEARAQAWIDQSDAYEIKENITINFVALWQTEEYKDVANLQRIYLCDTVNIYYEKLGINATAECIKVVYDSLRERYTSMELGTPKTTLAQQILETTSNTILKDVPSKAAMQSAIDKATELIVGGFGGYIKFNYLSDGTPSEMLIMNTPSESTATHIIRLNQNGIGFSTDGGTTYANAWTIDGNLNADFINSGTISADIINGGTLQLGGANNADGQLVVYDANGNVIGAWDNSGLEATGDLILHKIINSLEMLAQLGEITYQWYSTLEGALKNRTSSGLILDADSTGDPFYALLAGGTFSRRIYDSASRFGTAPTAMDFLHITNGADSWYHQIRHRDYFSHSMYKPDGTTAPPRFEWFVSDKGLAFGKTVYSVTAGGSSDDFGDGTGVQRDASKPKFVVTPGKMEYDSGTGKVFRITDSAQTFDGKQIAYAGGTSSPIVRVVTATASSETVLSRGINDISVAYTLPSGYAQVWAWAYSGSTDFRINCEVTAVTASAVTVRVKCTDTAVGNSYTVRPSVRVLCRRTDI